MQEHGDAGGGQLAALYARRLGIDLRGAPSVALLVELHGAHVRRIPFENLSIHLDEPLTLEPAALADKVLRRGRGGFCYELNGLFAMLLAELGYDVELLGARVWDGERIGPPLDHLVLRVRLGSERWLADVGFGDHSDGPLREELGVDQPDSAGTFRIEAPEEGLDVLRGDMLQYRIEQYPRVLADFDAMCWYQQTSPHSHFTRNVVCTRRTDDGRVTLSGYRLLQTIGTEKLETELADDDVVLEAYRRHFGIDLDRVPSVPFPEVD